jgi:hypothetical protein
VYTSDLFIYFDNELNTHFIAKVHKSRVLCGHANHVSILEHLYLPIKMYISSRAPSSKHEVKSGSQITPEFKAIIMSHALCDPCGAQNLEVVTRFVCVCVGGGDLWTPPL